MDKLTEEQKKRLMEAGQAAMNMSHGIKNIVQSLHAGQDVMDEALSRGSLDTAKRTWNILKENLDRIQKLAMDMLKFSKDEDLNLQPCHFNRLVKSVVETVRPQAARRQVEITVQVDETLETVLMDSDKIRDVVMNLILNAIEAVEPKTGHIAVRTESADREKKIIFCVRDNGPGIVDTSIIFEPFHSTKGNVGTGLGLTIARKIVQKHGGTIEAQSLPGEGSVFTIRLPLHTG